MEIEVNVRKLKLQIACILGVALLAVGFYTWRTYRWDQPWLRPLSRYDIITIRFDGLSCTDKEFAILKVAFLTPAGRVTAPNADLWGFNPEDISTDDRAFPGRYAWAQMIGHVPPPKRVEALLRIRGEVDAEIRKTGLSVTWRMALVTRDGSVLDPE